MKLKTDQMTQSPLFVGKISAQMRKHVIMGAMPIRNFERKNVVSPLWADIVSIAKNATLIYPKMLEVIR